MQWLNGGLLDSTELLYEILLQNNIFNVADEVNCGAIRGCAMNRESGNREHLERVQI